ncbi:uncharacterized protein AB675_641 [Cyphellophora attinorum]|uniref:Uncharacterized protein n=1 Tax=Cyphellophora attinorum TaxID=1664694 RepID=A0A0N1HB34_9EURO|nr:uncharacterized protein AB675_641 [Phialophora attinorum]KPI45584.1 hypothetical protein AB675_641 [Phialophora attinorum]
MTKVVLQAFAVGYEQETSRVQQDRLLLVEINFYGLREHADEVGKKMASLGLFLQRPLYGDVEVPHYNPQILSIEGYIPRESQQMLTSASADTASQKQAVSPPTVAAQETDSEAFDSILDSLSHHAILDQVTSIPGIKGDLLG